MIVCHKCGYPNDQDAVICQNCGSALKPDTGELATIPLEGKPYNVRPCRVCGHLNPVGSVFCEKCGQPMPGNLETPVFGVDELIARVREAVAHRAGQAVFAQVRFPILTFYVQNYPSPIVLTVDREIVLGRSKEAAQGRQLLDLRDYNAYPHGVSRAHALLRPDDGHAVLIDLGSTNGTYLNGRLLEPHIPYTVPDGAEIKLGELTMFAYYYREDKAQNR